MKLIFTLLLGLTFLFSSGIKEDYHFEKVAVNVYTLFGPIEEPNEHNKAFSNNPTAIIDHSGVILIDPSGSQVAGEYVLKEIRKITNKPIIMVFNTHVHGDHWLGNQAVIKHYPNVKIYAHPRMIERMNVEGPIWVDIMLKMTKGEVKGLEIVAPNTKVGHGQIITVGKQQFKIHNPTTKSHTDTDIMIEHINTKTLITGDNILYQRFGMFGDDSNILGNLEVANYVKDLNMSVYISGHGKPKKLLTGYESYLNYLSLLQEKVKTAYDEGVESYTIKDKILTDFEEYRSWIGFDTYFGKHIQQLYMEIEANDM